MDGGFRDLDSKQGQLLDDARPPQVRFSRVMRAMSCWTSLSTGGRPCIFFARDFRVHYHLKAVRCQPMTVSGCTMAKALCHPDHKWERTIQKVLSRQLSFGRVFFAL